MGTRNRLTGTRGESRRITGKDGEGTSQRTMNDPRTWTPVWGLTVGVGGGLGGGGQRGKIGTTVTE